MMRGVMGLQITCAFDDASHALQLRHNYHVHVSGVYVCMYERWSVYMYVCTWHIHTYMYICRPSPSNQSFYRLIAGYQRGAGDYRVGQ